MGQPMSSLQHHFNAHYGFLPVKDPLIALPEPFSAWEHTAQNLSKLMLSDRLRVLLEALPPFPVEKLTNQRELERAMLIMSFIGHAYVWGSDQPASKLPTQLALPWYQLSQCLGRPPVLSYASYALHNWRRLEADRPVELGNIALLQNFLGGIDEEWFILIHVDIEAKAIPAIAALQPAQSAVSANNPDKLLEALNSIEQALQGMCQSLGRMLEYCDPYIYYQRVRPYIHGWNNNPSLPDGLRYEGVEDYHSKPQTFRGETGAQSSIIPALDAALSVEHEDDPLKRYLLEMRDYMPVLHRTFVDQITSGVSIRKFIQQEHHNMQGLVEAYNQCILHTECFRTMHLEYADRYIQQQSQSSQANPTYIGTGGTPFMKYLDKHKRETHQFLI